MIPLSQVLVVEGRYDRNRLAQIFDAVIIDTQGFGIFKDREKLNLLRRLAERHGLIVLTDPDGGGLVIRNFLRGALGEGRVWHAYIPEIAGKERRKARPGKAGLLGVEGVEDQTLIEAVRRSGAPMGDESAPAPAMTRADFYALGLTGGQHSRARRQALCRRFGLPQNLSAASLFAVLGLISSYDELAALQEEAPR